MPLVAPPLMPRPRVGARVRVTAPLVGGTLQPGEEGTVMQTGSRGDFGDGTFYFMVTFPNHMGWFNFTERDSGLEIV